MQTIGVLDYKKKHWHEKKIDFMNIDTDFESVFLSFVFACLHAMLNHPFLVYSLLFCGICFQKQMQHVKMNGWEEEKEPKYSQKMSISTTTEANRWHTQTRRLFCWNKTEQKKRNSRMSLPAVFLSLILLSAWWSSFVYSCVASPFFDSMQLKTKCIIFNVYSTIVAAWSAHFVVFFIHSIRANTRRFEFFGFCAIPSIWLLSASAHSYSQMQCTFVALYHFFSECVIWVWKRQSPSKHQQKRKERKKKNERLNKNKYFNNNCIIMLLYRITNQFKAAQYGGWLWQIQQKQQQTQQHGKRWRGKKAKKQQKKRLLRLKHTQCDWKWSKKSSGSNNTSLSSFVERERERKQKNKSAFSIHLRFG